MPSSKLSEQDVRDRLKLYASEFAELCRMQAPKEQLLNGFGAKHGLNHVIELVNMVPASTTSEFRIRE